MRKKKTLQSHQKKKKGQERKGARGGKKILCKKVAIAWHGVLADSDNGVSDSLCAVEKLLAKGIHVTILSYRGHDRNKATLAALKELKLPGANTWGLVASSMMMLQAIWNAMQKASRCFQSLATVAIAKAWQTSQKARSSLQLPCMMPWKYFLQATDSVAKRMICHKQSIAKRMRCLEKPLQEGILILKTTYFAKRMFEEKPLQKGNFILKTAYLKQRL